MKHLLRLVYIFVWLLSIGIAGTNRVSAQGAANCPTSVLLAQSRAASACASAHHGEACYGSGTVSISAYANTPLTFRQAGDRVSARDIEIISVSSDADSLTWSVAQLRLSADLAASAGRTVTILLIGNAAIENFVRPIPQLNATAIGAVNLRAQPRPDGEVLDRIPVRADLIASGRTRDSAWVRVRQPNSNIVGWASIEVINMQGNVNTLEIVSDRALPLPFQFLNITTPNTNPLCDGAPASGVIIQTPRQGDPVVFSLSGWMLRLFGTAFIQEDAAQGLMLNLIDGFAEVDHDGGVWFIPAGARVLLPYRAGVSGGVVEPYDPSVLAALPLNSLPERLRRVPDPLTPEQIAAQTAAHFAVVATSIPSATPDPNQCRRVLARNETLRAGPGLNYEAINALRAGTALDPVLSALDNNGAIWWQLRGSNWLPRAAVRETGLCQDVPVTTSIQAPPNNTLPLETCESLNGPLRAGQRVTITFRPPAFDSLAEARAATTVYPGTITVNSQRLPVRASAPAHIGGGRYVRVFSAVWTAEQGNFRIVGERLGYTPSCSLTVPVG